MAGFRRNIIIPVIALAAAALFVVVAAEEASNTDFCKYSKDKPLCEKTVDGATDFNTAIDKAIKVALHEVKKLNTDDNVCKEFFEHSHHELLRGEELVKTGYKDRGLRFKLAAAFTNIEHCHNKVEEMKGDVPAAIKKNTDLSLAIRVALDIERYHREG